MAVGDVGLGILSIVLYDRVGNRKQLPCWEVVSDMMLFAFVPSRIAKAQDIKESYTLA